MSSPPATPTPKRRASVPRPPPSPLNTPSPGPSSGLNSPRRATTPHTAVAVGAGVPLPSPASPKTPSTPPPNNKARARDLLRKHYGLGVGPPPPLPGKPNDPMDLDSAAFDAKAYYEQLITTSSLPSLLKRENELLSEIRQLESERQSLVYNHHHELIEASDTIAAMKTRAESLDADLDLLKVAFSEISRLSTELSIEQDTSLQQGMGGKS